MNRLGRLIALPLLMIALALQGLAPARAAGMPRDAFGSPICTAHDLGGDAHRKAPAGDHTHDCCAAACAVAGLAAAPPQPAAVARTGYFIRIELRSSAGITPLPGSPLRLPRARGPPATILTA